MTGLRRVFMGSDGIRSGWRFLAFVLVWGAVGLAVRAGAAALGLVRPHAPPWDPFQTILAEAALLIAGLAATGVMLALTRRGAGAAGLALRPRAGESRAVAASGAAGAAGAASGSPRSTGPLSSAATGALWGAVAPSLVLGVVWISGAWSPGGLVANGAGLVGNLAVWLLVFLLVGAAEEIMFRGYPLYTLADGLGFWPAAILLSLLFGAAHLSKPGENPADIGSIILIGLFLCLTIRRTGALWWAMGFHAGFDFFALWVWGAPNGGSQLGGRLLLSHFAGPAWLTGGSLGLEASWLTPLVILAMVVAFDRAYPTPSPAPQ